MNNLEQIAPIPDWLVDYIRERGGFIPQTCFLCHAKGDFIGMFVTDEGFARRIGRRDSKGTVVYSLCEACLELPNSSDRVEDLILKQEQVQ